MPLNGPLGGPKSSRATRLKMKPAVRPFLKQAWAMLDRVELGSGFTSLGQVGPQALGFLEISTSKSLILVENKNIPIKRKSQNSLVQWTDT